MIVAIVGSREYPWPEAVREFVRDLPPGTKVISGGARGVDSIAVNEARDLGLPTQEYPADWTAFGKSAGFRRNQTVVANATHVVAFWDGRSKGTDHTIHLARRDEKLWYIYDSRGDRIEFEVDERGPWPYSGPWDG